jgi:hypothetical protein
LYKIICIAEIHGALGGHSTSARPPRINTPPN